MCLASTSNGILVGSFHFSGLVACSQTLSIVPFLLPAVIVLHRPAFFDSDDQASSSVSPSPSQDKCIASARAILSIARQYDQVYSLELPNQTFSLNFWIAGTILLLVAAQRPTDGTAQKNLTRIIDDLKLTGSVWIECTECADVLSKLHVSSGKNYYCVRHYTELILSH